MANNFFSVRDYGDITYYVSRDFSSITEVIAKLSEMRQVPGDRGGGRKTDLECLLGHMGERLEPITEEQWSAAIEKLRASPSEDRCIELNFDTDYARFMDWRAGPLATLTGPLHRIINAYCEALGTVQILDANRFAKEIAFLCDFECIKQAPALEDGVEQTAAGELGMEMTQ